MTEVSGALLMPAAPAPHGSEPPGHPPDTPFAAVLDDHQARTAVAEGHQQKRRDAADGDADRDDAGKPSADSTSSDASALAALLGGVPLPAGVKLTAVAIATAPQGETPATAGSPAGVATGASGLPAAADASATPMPTGPSVPAAATTLPLRPPVPASAASAEAAAEETAEQSIAAAPAASTAAARATRLADVLQSATARPTGLGAGAASTPDAAATPPAATVAGATARSSNQASDQGATNGAPAQPVAAAPVQPAAAAPAQAGTPVMPTAPAHGVGLEHAVETVRLALRAAADRGVTHARISLTPRELGSIEVHLRQTADGLVARVVAEHATAAQLLHNAGGELRRQLESQGLTLLRLDIGAQSEQRDRPLANGGGAFGDAGSAGDRSGADTDPLAPLDGTDGQASTTTTLALPNGALVDVLA